MRVIFDYCSELYASASDIEFRRHLIKLKSGIGAFHSLARFSEYVFPKFRTVTLALGRQNMFVAQLLNAMAAIQFLTDCYQSEAGQRVVTDVNAFFASAVMNGRSHFESEAQNQQRALVHCWHTIVCAELKLKQTVIL
jgi:hypothetical protein